MIAELKTQAQQAMDQMGKSKSSEAKIVAEMSGLERQREFEINEFTKAIEEQKEKLEKAY